jgi:vesicle-associated membrane protein 4
MKRARTNIMNRAEPYEPYIPNNAARAAGGNAAAVNSNTARVQQQVDEVVGIMQENIDKVMQRGERLDDLRGRTGKKKNVVLVSTHAIVDFFLLQKKEDLSATAGQFKRGANQVRKRMWWKDLKWKIIIAVTILVIIGIIIGRFLLISLKE